MHKQRLVVIGGGAAGFFGAIEAARLCGNQLEVLILEKSNKLLSKVKVSGGGRCNLTNQCEDPKELSLNYPRGNKKLSEAFRKFGTLETKQWFRGHEVEIATEKDGRVFPITNNSQTVIKCI